MHHLITFMWATTRQALQERREPSIPQTGTIDELRLFNFELNQGQVLGNTTATHPCPTFAIDHLELQPATWSGIVCSPGTMKVVACSNASCSSLYTQGLIATLSSTGAATLWDATAGGATIVIGAGQSSATRDFYTAAGTATMSVTGTGVPVLEANPKKCSGVAGSCNWTSTNDGLLVTVPNSGVITGGQPTAVTVQAVQSSGPTPGAVCLPVKNLSNAGLKAWSAPVTPAAFAGTSTSASVTVGGTPQVANAVAGTYVSTPLTLPATDNVTGLNFDSTASTTIWLKHMDTGQFSLNATLNVAATATTPALTLAGTGAARSVPVGYGIAAAAVTSPAATQTACAGGASAACDASAGAAPRVASAGDTFSAKVTAALWTVNGDSDLTDNPVAPSYAGTVALAASLVAPVGGNAGVLGATSATLTSGSATVAAQSWSAVRRTARFGDRKLPGSSGDGSKRRPWTILSQELQHSRDDTRLWHVHLFGTTYFCGHSPGHGWRADSRDHAQLCGSFCPARHTLGRKRFCRWRVDVEYGSCFQLYGRLGYIGAGFHVCSA